MAKQTNEGMVSEAQKRANVTYKNKYEQIVLRVPKGSRNQINQWVAEKANAGDNRCVDKRLGKPSVNTFIMNLLSEEMEKDGKSGIDLGIHNLD